jgi:hypothetical protein
MTLHEASHYDLIIVGGGLSGLSLASYLPTYSILILEAEDFIGGRVRSHQLENVYAELGAIFPFRQPRLSDFDCNSPVKPVGLYENGILYLGKDPLDALQNANPGSSLDIELLKSFANPYISLLNGTLRIPNQHFGALHRFSDHITRQIDAFHRVIHPEHAGLYSPAIVGHSLVDWPCIFDRDPNSSFVNRIVEGLGERVTVQIGSRVNQVSPDLSGQLIVQYRRGSNTLSAQSRLCAITTPGSQMLDTLKDIQPSSLGFYRNVEYASGIVCAIVVDEAAELPRYIVSPDQAWSSIIPLTRGGKTILHFYITGSHATSLWNSSDAEIIHILTKSMHSVGLARKSLGAIVQRWPKLGPILSERLKLSYYPQHFRLARNLWFAGEMALYTPTSPLSYGMAAAVKAGRMIASDILSA